MTRTARSPARSRSTPLSGTVYRIAVDGYGGANGSIVLNWSFHNHLPLITGFTPANGERRRQRHHQRQNLGGAIAVQFSWRELDTFTNLSPSQVTAVVPAGASTGPAQPYHLKWHRPRALRTSSSPATRRPMTTSQPPRYCRHGEDRHRFKYRRHQASGRTESRRQYRRRFGVVDLDRSEQWHLHCHDPGQQFRHDARRLYRHFSVRLLVTIASNDDGPNMGTASLVSFLATGGSAYQIAVDGYNAASGSIVLSVYPDTASQPIYFTGFESYESPAVLFRLHPLGPGRLDQLRRGPERRGVRLLL